MARNTQVSADHHAPPITRMLAELVAQHPSRGWSDAVDHAAHRTFLNWLGCAVGAASRGAHGIARAVQALRAGDRTGGGLRSIRGIRHFGSARCPVRRADHGGKRAVATGGERDAAAAREASEASRWSFDACITC